jgi:hypothetical protein
MTRTCYVHASVYDTAFVDVRRIRGFVVVQPRHSEMEIEEQSPRLRSNQANQAMTRVGDGHASFDPTYQSSASSIETFLLRACHQLRISPVQVKVQCDRKHIHDKRITECKEENFPSWPSKLLI